MPFPIGTGSGEPSKRQAQAINTKFFFFLPFFSKRAKKNPIAVSSFIGLSYFAPMSDDEETYATGSGTPGDDELSLPRATVQKLMTEILPKDITSTKEMRDILIDCCVGE